ncbi:MAG: PEP/pyruvate-binding domain-containing protein, partial [Nitrososphaeria archaeon]
MSDDNSILISLESNRCEELELVGGKAYKLAKLKKNGFLVPEGFVLTTRAFDKFISENSLMPNFLYDSSIKEENMVLPAQIEIALREIEKKNLGELIVRSSAVAEDSKNLSFAGLYESSPKLKSYDELKSAVIHCWLSSFSERVIAYIKSVGVNEQPKVALIIQKFIEPEAAGVVFTANPKNGDKDEIVINSVKGSGRSLLAGKQEGDEWIYKNGGAVCTNEPFKSLTLKQVYEIAKIAKKIEEYFSEPQDIEWAIKSSNIYILQSRPITHIEKRKQDYYFMVPSGPSDLILLYPDQQKRLDFSFLKEIMETSQYNSCSIYGWQYSLNLKQIHNFTYITDTAKMKDEEVPNEWKENLYFARDLIVSNNKKLIRKANLMAQQILESIKKVRTRQDARIMFEKNWLKWKDIFDLHYLVANFSQAEIEIFMNFIKNQVGISDISQSHLYDLLSGGGNYQTKINHELLKIGKLLKHMPNVLENLKNLGDNFDIIPKLKSLNTEVAESFEKLLKKHGKLMYSLNVSSESWDENPIPLLRMICNYAKEGDNKLSKKSTATQSKKILESVENKLRNDKYKKEQFEIKLNTAINCNKVLQDRDVLIVNPALYSAHRFFLRIGEILAASNQITSMKDIFYLSPNEIRKALSIPAINLKEVIERRKAEEIFWLQVSPPPRISKNFTIQERSEEQKNVFYGVGVSGGKTKGNVLIVKNFLEASKQISAKKILVAHDFDLSWTPLFAMAAGIITEVNFGLLSHTAVLAREYNLPTIAGVEGIMAKVADGDLVEIDAEIGRIEIVK